jgi:predicted alpha/beta superfamily hydrolase
MRETAAAAALLLGLGVAVVAWTQTTPAPAPSPATAPAASPSAKPAPSTAPDDEGDDDDDDVPEASPAPSPGAAPALTATPAPVPAATPAPETLLPHETWTLASDALRERRRVNVYLPAEYAQGMRLYPVLYLPDGGLGEDFKHVTSDVDAAIREGSLRPLIVVGIENTERVRDMTGLTTVESDRKLAPRVGGSAAFRTFLHDELFPAVDLRYRTNTHRAIMGESLAGLFVLDTLFADPGMFETYVSLSPSLWWNGGALATGAEQRLRAWPAGAPAVKLYVGTASDDELDAREGKVLHGALQAAAPQTLTWSWEPHPDLKHATIYRGASPALLRRYFPSPDARPAPVPVAGVTAAPTVTPAPTAVSAPTATPVPAAPTTTPVPVATPVPAEPAATPVPTPTPRARSRR